MGVRPWEFSYYALLTTGASPCLKIYNFESYKLENRLLGSLGTVWHS